jgi:hypothetical protein
VKLETGYGKGDLVFEEGREKEREKEMYEGKCKCP